MADSIQLRYRAGGEGGKERGCKMNRMEGRIRNVREGVGRNEPGRRKR